MINLKNKFSKKNLERIIVYIFLDLIMFTIFSYICQSFYIIFTKNNVFWTMTRINNTNFFFKFFPYIKELVLIVLFFSIIGYDYYFNKMKNSKKILTIFSIIVLIGLLLLLLSNNFAIGYIIAGLRIFLYLITVMLFCNVITINDEVKAKIDSIIKYSIIIEFLLVLAAIITSNTIFKFGSGAYRLMGTFGNGANLGYYTVACSLYFIIRKMFIKHNKKSDYVYFAILLFLSIASGSRVSILSNLFIILCYINYQISNKNIISNKKLIIYNMIGLLLLSPIIYIVLINKIGRGGFLVSGSYRINLFFSTFNVTSIDGIIKLIIGNGIGIGTNSARLLETKNSIIVDGTYLTIIFQYGLLGFIILLNKIITKIKSCDANIFIIISITISFIIIMFAVNIFEQFAFIVISIYSLYLLFNNKNNNEKVKKNDKKNIIYINNYMSDKVIKQRSNQSIFSQPGNNKTKGIIDSLLTTDSKITVLSNGLVNNKSFKKYKKCYDKIDNSEVIYCEIIDFPLINTLSSIYYIYKEIKKQNYLQSVDNIIFYNYKPETALAAYLAKVNLGIPITIEYEDGYSDLKDLGKFKSFLFKYTEKIVSKKVDSAILVNSDLKRKYSVPNVVIRGTVDSDFYNECKNYKKIKNKKFTILYSGGLDKVRGINVLIDSLKYIDFDFKLIITGKGEVKFDDKRIDFKGFIPYDEMKKVMMQSDLLIQCQLAKSSFSTSSFPSKIFEYIATGNYILSSNIADIKDFAKDNIYYYFNDDPKEMAKQIKEIYKLWENNVENKSMKELCEHNLPDALGKKIYNIL